MVRYLGLFIQQNSPPSEWIMCELGFFPILLENDFLKVDKILGLTFFQARKDFEGFKTAFWVLWSMDCLQLPFIRVEQSVSWTQSFLTRKIWPKNRSLFMTYKFESKCLQKLFFSISVNGGFRNIYLNIQPPFTSISKKSC